jgi:hypothetical protein
MNTYFKFQQALGKNSYVFMFIIYMCSRFVYNEI